MVADPRDITPVRHGTPMRDAAVDPKPGDFLPPVNAGKVGEDGNPHGPNVYAPGIHAVQGIRPVTPGPVSPDADTQSTVESAHATKWQGPDPTDTVPAPDPEPEVEDGP